ncbi:hypothetical protein [Fusobacterium varium]|uniref:hypothetical protein n=1 Tax=Fusobacterium varium TaxID=856 RepID=UPI002FE45750
MKIGILYIGIGRYSIFFKGFYESCEKYFLPKSEKTYYIFSDKELKEWEGRGNIRLIKEKDYGWPGNTLYRFHMFKKIEEELKKNDYIFFFNSNYNFIDFIYENEILFKKEEIIALDHDIKKEKHKIPYDRNSKSQAFFNFDEGGKYYQGGLNGGKTESYIELINSCITMIEEDKKINYIAEYNDESYLNKYLVDKNVFSLCKDYGMPEEWGISLKTKGIFLDKNKILGDKQIKNQKKELYGFIGRKRSYLNKFRYLVFKMKKLIKGNRGK